MCIYYRSEGAGVKKKADGRRAQLQIGNVGSGTPSGELRCDFEDYAVAGVAAEDGAAVEVPFLIEHEIALW